ncbi:ABC transporter substrate-binding protein [Subtercola frigoramans]|uniref:Multiple sugar transport system substrate-binding protein n=1 Tax=Subtercola frigoramans TaxID=120298 RepID=A0ABS2L7P4_9MICO|nr:sugar ABC transporter substrate-binding protein [Subtercola frigoramans]MBM7473113.1 multiple sugar transport system substrate-binding protein [Subtercola frigoramans]
MKHRIARIAAAVATLGVVAGALTGCTGQSTSNEPVTLKWWAPNLSASIADDVDYYKTLVAPFTKDTGISVDVEVNAWGDYYNKILGAITAGEGPDLISTGTTWVSPLTDSGAFVQFDNSTMDSIGGSSQFVPTALKAAGGDNTGGPSMIPWVTGVTQMWYNKKLFAAAGITAPPASWSEFVSDAKKLTLDTNGDGQIDQWGFGYPAGFAQEWAHTMFAFGEQNNAPFFTDAGKANLNAPGMVDAAQQFVDLMNVDKVMSPSNVEDVSFSPTYQNVIDGKAAMIFAPGANGAFDQAKFADYGVAQIPLVDNLPGKPITTHIAGVNIGVFGATKHRDESLQLLKFLSSESTQVDVAVKLPNILPANSAAFGSDKVDKSEVFTTSESILKNTAAGYPLNTLAGQAETVIGDAMKQIMSKAATSGSASRADIQAILDAANGQLAASQ